jgi:hypothetical protein
MHKDPIVEEVRRHRLARAAKFNFDLDAIVADVRSREGIGGLKLATSGKLRRRKWRSSGKGGVTAGKKMP